MLGNFSFGDYFKEEAIPFAWEFLTKTLEIPENLLWPSIYENDEEAFHIWRDVIGVPEERIVRLGKADNFWEHGTGPCGPCSEIYFDRGEKYGCGAPDCKPGCDCDRYMEIWNNVFSQFNNDGQGNYTELAQKNIDTGMGLERLACVLQGVDNLFEVDTVRRILDTVCDIAGKTYGENASDDVSIRVVTDHLRGATFMICDGVLPSNEGRGYVLRRILRRAARHGKLLGIRRAFLPDISRVVISQNETAYPELVDKRDYILKVITLEEERFNATIDSGLSILSDCIKTAKDENKSVLSGEDVFRLYDTYGFPVDLTREIAAESGLSVDDDAFKTLMEEQRNRARAARGNISGWSAADGDLPEDLPATEFAGYTENTCEATVLAILTEGGMTLDSLTEGEATVVLDRTVMYGEGGGQVGDTGCITSAQATLTVTDTKKTNGVYLHNVALSDGILNKGDKVTVTLDVERREAIRRNHSACHLLQAALRHVLGSHVSQAGSYVDEHRVRFDFSHFAAMTADEIAKVEALVNSYILSCTAVNTVVTDQETARKEGATALFDEKYGKEVRMVKMGDVSCELCGGTHVSNTSAVCLFKIISETSVAAGVRRIEGTTGLGVLALLTERDTLLADTAKELKAANVHELPRRASLLRDELKESARQLESATAKLAEVKLDSMLASARQVGKIRLLTARLEMKPDAARALCDSIKARYADMVAVFALVDGDKLNFIACCGTDAVKAGAHAGNILREVSAVTGGKGGGRPDNAMSGGRDISRVDDALALVSTLVPQA